MIRKVMVIAAMFGALSACNTVAGMGKDVQSGGEKVQRRRERAKENVTPGGSASERKQYFRSLCAGPISTISG